MGINWRVLTVMGWMAIGIAALSCQRNEPIEGKGPFTWNERSFERHSSQCDVDTNRCAKVKAVFPFAVKGPEQVRDKLNQAIERRMRQSLSAFVSEEETIPGSFETIAEGFLQEYATMQSDEPGYDIPWTMEATSKVLHQSERLVSIELTNYSYAGGNHPNYYVSLLNFDAQTGEELLLSDIFTDTLKLAELAERRFREVRGLAPNDSLSDAGFFWGTSFTLPENIGIKGDSLYFFYNPYEIAPYVMGPTEFSIPIEEVKSVLRKEKIIE